MPPGGAPEFHSISWANTSRASPRTRPVPGAGIQGGLGPRPAIRRKGEMSAEARASLHSTRSLEFKSQPFPERPRQDRWGTAQRGLGGGPGMKFLVLVCLPRMSPVFLFLLPRGDPSLPLPQACSAPHSGFPGSPPHPGPTRGSRETLLPLSPWGLDWGKWPQKPVSGGGDLGSLCLVEGRGLHPAGRHPHT